MSYNLMIFEEDRAPKTKDEFMQWFRRQTEWGEDHDYDSIEVSGPALKAWFMEMKDHFPPMNGEFAPDPDEFEDFDTRTGDYSIGREMIYAGFAWSAAKEAHELACQLAKKHGLGFFDAGGDGKIFFPTGRSLTQAPAQSHGSAFSAGGNRAGCLTIRAKNMDGKFSDEGAIAYEAI